MKVDLTDIEAMRVSRMFISDAHDKVNGAKEASNLWGASMALRNDAQSTRHVLETLDTPYINSLLPRIVAIKLGDTEYEP